MHKGTNRPANQNEHQALQATVRLKVQDAQGSSYATGTVIHCHQGEWLIMTCGHAFREAGYQGKIVGEYNFAEGNIRSAPAELISYDAGPRDIALVAMRTGEPVQPIKLAVSDQAPGVEQAVFSLGCDKGADPTIRHTKIKHKALYDGASKFVIYGRPTIGRSGGGLFNEAGELVGVCNAAMVDSDEGVYTSLETVHWQIAQANLTHLFNHPADSGDQDRLASREPDSLSTDPSANLLAVSDSPKSVNFASDNMQPLQRDRSRVDASDRSSQRTIEPAMNGNLNRASGRSSDRAGNSSSSHPSDPSGRSQTLVSWADQQARASIHPNYDDDHEVIIIVRNKSDSRVGQSITINDPTPELLEYLDRIKATKPETEQLEMARWRE